MVLRFTQASFTEAGNLQVTNSKISFTYYLVRLSLYQILPSVILFLCFPSFCRGQDSTVLTASLGYRLGIPHSIERSPGAVNLEQFSFDGSGSSINHIASFGLGIDFPDIIDPHIGLACRLGITFSNGSFTSNPYQEEVTAVNRQTGFPIFTQNSFVVDVTENQMQFDALAFLHLTDKVNLFLGPWIGYRFSSNIVQTEHILEPANAIFKEEESNERLIATGDAISSFQWRFGGVANVGYTYIIGPGLDLSPELTARFDIEALIDKGLGFRAFDLGLNLGIRFTPFVNTTPQSTLPSNTAQLEPPSFRLSTSIDFYIDDSTISNQDIIDVVQQQKNHQVYIPLIPTVQCNNDLSFPLSQYNQLSPSTVADFSTTSLPNATPSWVQANVLNILALRMQELPESTLQLQGNQADVVRNYLTTVWKLQKERVSIKSGKDNHVEILPSSPLLLAPFRSKWITEQSTTPTLQLRKDIVADAGLEEWKITIYLDDNIITSFSNKEGASNNDLELPLLSMDGTEENETHLTAELQTRDYTGQLDVAYDTLTLHRVSRSEIQEVNEYYFLPTESTEGFDLSTEVLLEVIGRTTQTGATITIESPTGTGTYRDVIAEHIITQLRKSGIEVNTIHITEYQSLTTVKQSQNYVYVKVVQDVE